MKAGELLQEMVAEGAIDWEEFGGEVWEVLTPEQWEEVADALGIEDEEDEEATA